MTSRTRIRGQVRSRQRIVVAGTVRRALSVVHLLLALLLLAGLPALAHNPDTSYARIRIGADRVEFQFTYDLFTLLKIVRLDDDGDRRISRDELQRHAGEIDGFLRRHLLIEINERESDLGEPAGFVWPPDTGDAIPERDYHSAAGLIHFRFVKPMDDTPEDVAVTFDFFQDFGERHIILGVFEHEGRHHEVIFNRFEPDYLYDTGYRQPLTRKLAKFLKLGVEHIFLGYDHILFLLALVVVSRLRQLVWIVTSFTVAHSITLILAALEVVTLPGRLVEVAIAATIIYVAAENLWTKQTGHRWLLTFAFGLVHGFGFAGVLRELGLPSTGLVQCLLAFNVGVEVGQLAIVLLMLPLVWGLGRWEHGGRAKAALSVLIGLFGLAWFIERALGLSYMPV